MRVMVAIPTMGTVKTQTVQSLIAMEKPYETEVVFTEGSLVYDARNAICKKAIAENFDRVLWIDSDMIFDTDLMTRLSARLDEGLDFCTGLYFTRRPPDIKPVIYNALVMTNDGLPQAYAMYEYPDNSLFEIAASGFGGVMVTTELIKSIGDKFGLPFSPVVGFGEDFSFCIRAKELGRSMWCDSSIKLGHTGEIIYDEQTYRRFYNERKAGTVSTDQI